MANLKISQLPEYSGNTSGSYLVMNNSGETITYKVKKENYIFPYEGVAVITGSLSVSGSVDLKIGNITAGKGGGFKQNNTVFGAGTLISNSVGDFNTAVGYVSLFSNTSGSRNVGLGFYSLANNTTGNENTAIGYQALASNITQDSNTAVGHNALLFNDARNNVAIGADAMKFNTSGVNNVAVGTNANALNTSGNSNTIIGFQSNYNNRIGGRNTTLGDNTMFYNVSGSNNVAIGLNALLYNTFGDANVAIGTYAGRYESGSNNFYLHNSVGIPYSSIDQERSGSLMWGTFNSTSSVFQTLQINASTDIRNNLTISGSITTTSPVSSSLYSEKSYFVPNTTLINQDSSSLVLLSSIPTSSLLSHELNVYVTKVSTNEMYYSQVVNLMNKNTNSIIDIIPNINGGQVGAALALTSSVVSGNLNTYGWWYDFNTGSGVTASFNAYVSNTKSIKY